MYNEIIWLAFAVLDLGLTVIIYRYFGKTGLYALIPFNLILCNIQVLKTVMLFGFTTTLGNILYTSVFLTTNILCEFHGKKAAKTGIIIGFIILVMTTVYMQIALMYTPAPSDFMHTHLAAMFEFFPRLALASIIAYSVSQIHDVWAFHFWHKKTAGKWLWLRNGAATITSQLIDSVIFCLIAFAGVFERAVLLEILFTTFLFKVIVSCLDTPFIYLARLAQKMRTRNIEKDKQLPWITE